MQLHRRVSIISRARIAATVDSLANAFIREPAAVKAHDGFGLTREMLSGRTVIAHGVIHALMHVR